MPALDTTLPTDRTKQMAWLSEGNRAHEYCVMNGQMILAWAAERHRQVFGMPDPQVSDEIGSAAMATLIKRAAAGSLLKFTKGVEPFLMGTIANITLNRFCELRARRRPTCVEVDPDRIEAKPLADPLGVNLAQLESYVDACMAGLSPQERQVITMRRATVPAATSAMIAEQLDVTPSHVDVVLSKARKKLFACLTSKGVPL